MKIGRKAVADAVALSSGYFHIVSCSRQVAHYLRSLTGESRSPETASNEDNANRLRFFVGERQKGLSWVAIDELDAEDFRGWKRC